MSRVPTHSCIGKGETWAHIYAHSQILFYFWKCTSQILTPTQMRIVEIEALVSNILLSVMWADSWLSLTQIKKKHSRGSAPINNFLTTIMTDLLGVHFFENVFCPKGWPKNSQKLVCLAGKVLVNLPPPFCPILGPSIAHIRQTLKKHKKLRGCSLEA